MSNNKQPQYRIKLITVVGFFYYSVHHEWNLNPQYACIFDSKYEALEFANSKIIDKYIIIEEFYKL
jgi:hypothetical protein